MNEITLLGTAPSLEASKKQVAAFYAGETKEFKEAHKGRQKLWTIHNPDGSQCAGLTIRKKSGRYRFEMT